MASAQADLPLPSGTADDTFRPEEHYLAWWSRYDRDRDIDFLSHPHLVTCSQLMTDRTGRRVLLAC